MLSRGEFMRFSEDQSAVSVFCTLCTPLVAILHSGASAKLTDSISDSVATIFPSSLDDFGNSTENLIVSLMLQIYVSALYALCRTSFRIYLSKNLSRCLPLDWILIPGQTHLCVLITRDAYWALSSWRCRHMIIMAPPTTWLFIPLKEFRHNLEMKLGSSGDERRPLSTLLLQISKTRLYQDDAQQQAVISNPEFQKFLVAMNVVAVSSAHGSIFFWTIEQNLTTCSIHWVPESAERCNARSTWPSRSE